MTKNASFICLFVALVRILGSMMMSSVITNCQVAIKTKRRRAGDALKIMHRDIRMVFIFRNAEQLMYSDTSK